MSRIAHVNFNFLFGLFMQVQNSNVVSVVSTESTGINLDSKGFENLLESSRAKIGHSESAARISCVSQDPSIRKENTLVHLGVISSSHPTVSHLLIKHPEYGKDCWKIIHSDINKDKPYTRIPEGTHICLDPKSKEIIWDYEIGGKAGGENRHNFQTSPPKPTGGNPLAELLPKEHYQTHAVNKGTKEFLPGMQDNATSEQQIIDLYVSRAAAKHDLPEALIRGVIKAESNFQVNAVSSAGAQGLMQLMPATARELGVENPFNIADNIDAGTKYLKKMLNTFDGDLVKALAAYNAGPQTIKNHQGRIPFQETRNYVQRVLSFLDYFQKL